MLVVYCELLTTYHSLLAAPVNASPIALQVAHPIRRLLRTTLYYLLLTTHHASIHSYAAHYSPRQPNVWWQVKKVLKGVEEAREVMKSLTELKDDLGRLEGNLDEKIRQAVERSMQGRG